MQQVASRLEAAVEAFSGRPNLCGVLRISRAGTVLFERAYGQASVQLGVPNRPDTRFHIASITKAFISAAVVRLVRDEVVSLQEHPSKYVPEVSALDPRITLHQLLTHTSGLADIYAVRNVRIEMAALVERSDRLIDYLASLPQVVEPGSAWRYSSTGYLVLAYLLERIVGSSYETLLHEKLLTPLGLADTGVDDPCRVNYGRASGHIGRDGSWQNAPNDALAEVDGPRELYSTAADLDRWASALLDGRVLDAAGVELTFSPHARVGPGSDFDPNLSYGYGWFLGPTYRWIGGVTGGFRAALWQYPSERLNVVMLWNNETVNSHRLFAALRPVLLG